MIGETGIERNSSRRRLQAGSRCLAELFRGLYAFGDCRWLSRWPQMLPSLPPAAHLHISKAAPRIEKTKPRVNGEHMRSLLATSLQLDQVITGQGTLAQGFRFLIPYCFMVRGGGVSSCASSSQMLGRRLRLCLRLSWPRCANVRAPRHRLGSSSTQEALGQHAEKAVRTLGVLY